MHPGSHVHGQLHHETTRNESNVLFNGQTVAGVHEDDAVVCALRAGQASFHHGWTLHSSGPNQSDDRRIGLNVQFLATHMRQTKNRSDSAILVRGRDDFGHFEQDVAATSDLGPVAVARQKELQARYKSIAGTT